MRSSEEHTEPEGAVPPPDANGKNGGNGLLRHVKRVVTSVVGFTVLAVGVAMIVLPGPAFIVIPVGLGILAAEFAWARRWLHRIREQGNRILGR